MRIIHSIRHSVGLRLLLGFWLTIILALLSVWLLSRWTTVELDFNPLDSMDSQRLERATMRVIRGYERGLTLKRLVQPFPRSPNVAIVLYDVEEQQLISVPSRHLPRLKEDVDRLSKQQTPLVLKRPPYKLVGPEAVLLDEREFLVFVQQRIPMGANNVPRVAVLLLALFALSVIFSVVFTRSLLRPIRALRQASQELANGHWDVRVDSRQFGKDEMGELAHGFNHMAQKIGDNLAAQKRLLADVSHELRSPLARLNMAVGLAEQASDQSEMTRKSLQRIEAETAKMDQLIGDILTLSRAESSMSKRESVSLNMLLAAVLHNAEFEATQQALHFQMQAIPDAEVRVHAKAVQSAVENIIRNAIRYTHSKVEVTFALDDSSWQITVTDDGPGLDEVELESIFSPFYRSDEARSRHTGGVGLGLAIAKAAVTAHHGTISASNQPNGGLAVNIKMAK